jgi:hypothetical protein
VVHSEGCTNPCLVFLRALLDGWLSPTRPPTQDAASYHPSSRCDLPSVGVDTESEQKRSCWSSGCSDLQRLLSTLPSNAKPNSISPGPCFHAQTHPMAVTASFSSSASFLMKGADWSAHERSKFGQTGNLFVTASTNLRAGSMTSLPLRQGSLPSGSKR